MYFCKTFTFLYKYDNLICTENPRFKEYLISDFTDLLR